MKSEEKEAKKRKEELEAKKSLFGLKSPLEGGFAGFTSFRQFLSTSVIIFVFWSLFGSSKKQSDTSQPSDSTNSAPVEPWTWTQTFLFILGVIAVISLLCYG